MGNIKTALELALERTSGLKADHSGAELSDAKKTGRSLAAAFMDGKEGSDLKAAISAQPKQLAATVRDGAIEVLLSYIQFPRDSLARDKTPPANLDRVREGLAALSDGTGAKQIAQMMEQIKAFLARYLQDIEQLEKAVLQQFSGKLRQKEQELARRSGQEVKIDPHRDPEFQAYFSKNLAQLKTQYQEALDRVKQDAKAIVRGE